MKHHLTLILPVNDPTILNVDDIKPYLSDKITIDLKYPATDLQVLENEKDVATVLPLVDEAILRAAHAGTDSIVVCAFGDVCIRAVNEFDRVPKVSLGRIMLRALSKIAKHKFTVLPLHQNHIGFVELMVCEEVVDNYMTAPKAVGLEPNQLRHNPGAMEYLISAAKEAVELCEIDALTVGVPSFMGMAKTLELELKQRYNYDIQVLEPMDTVLRYQIFKLSHEYEAV